MKVLSVRQPWAHAILHLGKNVENRSWATTYRGPVAIHASKTPAKAGTFLELGITRSAVTYGAVVGVVQLVDARRDMHEHSLWAEPGKRHWVLDQPQCIEPIPHMGRLRLYDADDLLRQRVLRALSQRD